MLDRLKQQAKLRANDDAKPFIVDRVWRAVGWQGGLPTQDSARPVRIGVADGFGSVHGASAGWDIACANVRLRW